MNVVTRFLRLEVRNFTPRLKLRTFRCLPVQFVKLLLLAACLTGTAANAQVVADSISFPPDIGREQTVDVTVDWSRVATAVGDTIRVAIPPELAVNPPAPPAGCVYNAPDMVCNVPDGATGATGTIIFQVRGVATGGFNLTAIGTSAPNASASGSVNSTGDIIIGKTKQSPAGNPVAGGELVFTLTPQITSGDDVPIGASIVVTDNLPGTVTDFDLTARTFNGLTPSCNSVAAANGSRTLTCTYAGPFTRAAMNASTITVTGTPGNNGGFTNVASIASGNPTYFDSDATNNIVNVAYTVDPGTDVQALGSFPSSGQIVGTSQNLQIAYRNNGPLAAVSGGIVETIVPSTFTIGTLPAGCSQTLGQSRSISGTTYNGTLVQCTAGALAVNAQQAFTIPLTLPLAPEASSFPVIVTSPPSMGDANTGNNSLLLPYQIVDPFADLRAFKAKTPGGPQAPGTSVSTTLTIRNEGTSTGPAAYNAAQPLRIIDYMRPEEMAGNLITLSPASITAGWSCTVEPGLVPPSFIGDVNKTTRVNCINPGPGSLAVGASLSVGFGSTIAAVGAPVELTDRACTGSQALIALGLTAAQGPQPPDGNRTANDCADAGSGLVATPVVSGNAQVNIAKLASVNNTTFIDPVASAPTLLGDASTLYWRMIVTTPVRGNGPNQNPNQETIPTLFLTDTLPGIVNVTSPGAPAPAYQTPAISVVTTPTTWGSCPATIAAGSNALNCAFNNVPPGVTITVDIPVSRALEGGVLTNTATLTSPNAILTPTAGGRIEDDAAVNVVPRVDVALTTKTVAPAEPSVGQIVQFTVTAQNLGSASITGNGQFTITDTLFTGTATLLVPAYEIVNVTPSNPAKISCAASNLASGAISCTNIAAINRYETQTITIAARIKKPSGLSGAAQSTLYSGVTNTAQVVLSGGLCEFKTETATSAQVSATCNDATSTSNNARTVSFDIKVPAIDLQQGKVAVFPAGQTRFLIGDQLRYRFSVRNAGPSRAEQVVMTDLLTVPPGFQISVAAAMPDQINQAVASAGYTLVSKAVTCTQAAANAAVVCRLNTDLTQSFLDAGQEVNFEIAMNMTGTASGPVTFGNSVYVCADETNTYEASGQCSPNPALAGNNLAAVNNVVFPRADLELVSKTTVTPSPVDVAQPIEYAIVLRNNGTASTTKMRLSDTLPTGFEWINSGAFVPLASINGGSAATLSGALSVVGAVPANGAENVCFISNGVNSVTTLSQQQQITCDISGAFPPGAANTITVKLYARAKPGLYDGSAAAPFLTNRTNNAAVLPGKNADGDDVSIDDNPANNNGNSTVQVRDAAIGGRVFIDLNNNGDQDGATSATDEGIGGVTLTLTGTDLYGNSVSRTITTSNAAAGVASVRGDYLFSGLAPSDAVGYTITQTQPAGFGNGQPQPNTPRTVRNGTSNGITPVGGSYTVSNTTTSSVIAGVAVASGGAGVQFDFPEIQDSNLRLSGYVYLDANNDGLKGGSEAGISGVTVTLIGCARGINGTIDTLAIGAGPAACTGDDTPVSDSATTDANGFYSFTLAEPGRYSVIEQVTQPVVNAVSTVHGKTTAGSVDRIGSAVGANDGGTRGTVNTTGNPSGGNPGVLQEIAGGIASSIRDIVISSSGAQSVNNNFGELLPGSIAGFVYTEKGTAGSNYQPGTDWPFAGVLVTLTGTDDLGRSINASATTAADGSYSFPSLRPGTYMVVKTNPSRPGNPVINETNGAFPGRDAGNATVGSRVGDETVNSIALVSAAQITQTNFAVTNGTRVELALAKTHTGTIIIGQPATYTLTITNKGDSPTFGVVKLVDLLPAGMSPRAVNPITSTFGAISNTVINGQNVSFDFTPTTPIAISNGTATVQVHVEVAALAQGNVINYATVTGGGDPFVPPSPGPACTDPHCANDPTSVSGPPVLALAKTGPTTLILGSKETYTLTITNSGEAATIGTLSLVEQLPPGLDLDPANVLRSTDGVISNVVRTGNLATGVIVNFDFAPTIPLAATNGTAAIEVPVLIDVNTPIGVSTNYASVGGGGDTRGNPPTPGSACADTRCANVPANVEGAGLLSIVKTANKRDVELGDMVTYTLTISNISQATVVRPRIVDRLPQGFRLIENTSRVSGATLVNMQGAPGPVITYALDRIAPGATITITYRVRVAVGSMQGDGVNRASAECPLNPTTKCSNEARYRVKVTGGVFTNDACIVGMIYVDCNGNQIKDHEELGIPGVRMYAENGLFLISDSEGKYSYCGFSPKTHVLKVDQTTLPRGSRLVSSSNRNVGDANSLFLDLKNGELQRADFIEGSCSNTVVEQVQARRTQGEISAPHVEKKGGVGFNFEGKAPNYPQQGTDSANQLIVKPRMDDRKAIEKAIPAETISERDIPVRKLEINQGGRDAR